MRIPKFKNEEVLLEEFKLNELMINRLNSLEDVFKTKEDLLKFIDILEKYYSSLFILELDINEDGLKNVFVFGSNQKISTIYFIDNNTILFNEKGIYPAGNTVDVKLNKDFFLKEYQSNNESFKIIDPYNFKKQIESLLRDFANYNGIMHTKYYYIPLFISKRIETFFKKDLDYNKKMFENICYNHFDKELFKELYSYSLHSYKDDNSFLYNNLKIRNKIKDMKKNNIYNVIAKNPHIKSNFLRFKKDNSFLSMIFINEDDKTLLELFSKDYDENFLYSRIKKILTKQYKFITDEQFNHLKRKSYNNFLYVKTPAKYFRFMEMADIKDLPLLTTLQQKFLNSVFKKNNLYLNKDLISKILVNDKFIEKALIIFEIRKLTHVETKIMADTVEEFFGNIDLYINKVSYTLKNIETIDRTEVLFLENIKGKKVKIRVVNNNFLINEITNYINNEKTLYNNTKYFMILFKFIFDNPEIYFIEITEGRQKHVIAMKINPYTSSQNYSLNCSPRVESMIEDIIIDSNFIDYLFNVVIFN